MAPAWVVQKVQHVTQYLLVESRYARDRREWIALLDAALISNSRILSLQTGKDIRSGLE